MFSRLLKRIRRSSGSERSVALVLGVALTMATVLAIGTTTAAAHNATRISDSQNVTICHANANGWVSESPSWFSFFQGGHDSHTPGGNADIIPAFTYALERHDHSTTPPQWVSAGTDSYGGRSLATVFPSFPWTTGADILANSCVVPPEPVIDVCDNLDDDQATIPDGHYELNGSCYEYQKVSPVLENNNTIIDNCDGTFTATWGYNNENLVDVNIPIGAGNFFSPGAQDQGQPTTFSPGANSGVFTTPVAGSSLVWSLTYQGLTATATASTGSAVATNTPPAGTYTYEGECYDYQRVLPLVSSITRNCDGSFTVSWGYNNNNLITVTGAPILANELRPTTQPQEQPTTFAPGIHHNVFSTTYPAGSGRQTWFVRIDGTSSAGRVHADEADAVLTTTPPEGMYIHEGECHSFSRVRVQADSVTLNCDDTFTISWGYNNTNPVPVTAGDVLQNELKPAQPQVQPTDFEVGTHSDVFTTTHAVGDGTQTWVVKVAGAGSAHRRHVEESEAVLTTDPEVGYYLWNGACERLKKVLTSVNSVTNNCDGTYTASWGYNNRNAIPLTIDVGADNRFVQAPEYRGQVSDFEPGVHDDAFETTFDGNTLRWRVRTPDVGGDGAVHRSDAHGDQSVNECPDFCDNMDGYQTEVPEGYAVFRGNCYWDACPNLLYWQPTTPIGYYRLPEEDPRVCYKWQPVTVSVTSVVNNCDDTYTATFGYNNPNHLTINRSVSLLNIVIPGPWGQGQPTSFTADTSDPSAFSVEFTDVKIWALTAGTVIPQLAVATGESASNECEDVDGEDDGPKYVCENLAEETYTEVPEGYTEDEQGFCTANEVTCSTGDDDVRETAAVLVAAEDGCPEYVCENLEGGPYTEVPDGYTQNEAGECVEPVVEEESDDPGSAVAGVDDGPTEEEEGGGDVAGTDDATEPDAAVAGEDDGPLRELPFTGRNEWLAAGIGALLLLLGGVMHLIGWRRGRVETAA